MADGIVDQSVEAAATDTLADEIADMMDVGVGIPVEEDPIQQEEVSSESNDTPVEASAEIQEESGEVVSNPEPTETVESSEPTELELLKSQVESLKGIISQLSGPKESASTAPELKPDLDNLLQNVDFDGIMESREQFVGFIKDLVTSVAQNTQAYVQGFVPQTITSHMSMQEVREQFYQDNPELNPVRPYVANIASTVAAEQPEWGLQEVLTEAAKRAKAALNIREVPKTVREDKGPAPTLPGSKGGRKPTPQKTALQNELDEFMED